MFKKIKHNNQLFLVNIEFLNNSDEFYGENEDDLKTDSAYLQRIVNKIYIKIMSTNCKMAFMLAQISRNK